MKKYTVLFSIFMEVEAHLDANYGKNDRFEFEKFSYPHRKSRTHLGANYGRNGRYEFEKSYYSHRKSILQPIFLININKLYL